eukprot:9947-Heterococcus_DN1.PRE.3
MEAKSESKSSALDEDDLKHGAKALSHVIAASKVCIWACKQVLLVLLLLLQALIIDTICVA